MHPGADGLPPAAMPRWVRIALWAGFAVAHAFAGIFAVLGERPPFGDVGFVYQPWAVQIVSGGPIPGIGEPWVYPIGALLPLLLPLLAGAGSYTAGWFVLVVIVDGVAFGVLTAHLTRGRVAAASWWLIVVASLGPVAVSRLDAVAAAVVLIGLLAAAARPVLAGAVLALAVWIKVWPFALLAAALVALGARGRILAGALGTSVVITTLGLALGGGANLTSFVGTQATRGLEIEAPLALPWMWQAAAGVPGAAVYYDGGINTYQVTGPGIGSGIALGTPLLAATVLVVALVTIRAVLGRRAVPAILPTLALALVSALIVGNKVGSPQYTSWLIPPIVVGIVLLGRRFAAPAALGIGISVTTMLDYPLNFDGLIHASPISVAIVSVRSALLVAMYLWCVVRLWRDGTTGPIVVPARVASPYVAESGSRG